MKISKPSEDYQILVSRDELRTIGHGLLEAWEALSDGEFPIRVGVEASEVKGLLEQIVKAYREQ